MRVGLLFNVLLVLLCVPSLAMGQGTSSLAYRPSEAASRLAVTPSVGAPQDTVRTSSEDPYAVDNSVVTGAAVGGIFAGTAVVINTLTAGDDEVTSWAAIVSAPIIGGLVGAGIGYLLR